MKASRILIILGVMIVSLGLVGVALAAVSSDETSAPAVAQAGVGVWPPTLAWPAELGPVLEEASTEGRSSCRATNTSSNLMGSVTASGDVPTGEPSLGVNPVEVADVQPRREGQPPSALSLGTAESATAGPVRSVFKSGITAPLWQARAPSPVATMDGPVVQAILDGGLWVVGGYQAGGATQRYDPSTDIWTIHASEPVPTIPFPVDACYGLNASGEEVVVLFPDTSGSVVGMLHRYNITTDAWDTPPVPAPFPANGIWALDIVSMFGITGENLCYISGGATTPGGGNLSDLWVYDPAANAITNLGPFTHTPWGFDFHASWFVPWVGGAGGICVGGGVDLNSAVYADTQCYDLAVGAFNPPNLDLGLLPEPWWGMADGWKIDAGQYQIWIVDGVDAGFALLQASALIDVTTGGFIYGPPPVVPRFRLEGDGWQGFLFAEGGSSGGFSPTSDNQFLNQILPPPPECGFEVLFYEDFESGYGNWSTSGLWNPENEADVCGSMVAPFPSSSNDAYYGIDATCTYSTGAGIPNSGYLELLIDVDLSAAIDATLEFWSFEQTECGIGNCGYDSRTVEVSTDNGATWTLVWGSSEPENAWYQASASLSAYVGGPLRVRFYFDTGDALYNDYFGWMVDDIQIWGSTPDVCLTPPEITVEGCAEVPQGHVLRLWNYTGAAGTFNLSYDVPTGNATLDGPASLSVGDGMFKDFEVALTPNACLVQGVEVIGTIEASGNGFTGTSVLAKTILPEGPVAWESVPASAPAWAGSGYLVDGCTARNVNGSWVTYIIGDQSGSGPVGFWGYNHTANTWFNPGATGTPADRWAPDWAYDPETNLCFLTGGATVPGTGNLSDAYVYDPIANAFYFLGNFTTVRDFHDSWVGMIGGTKYLCVGGGNSGGAGLASTQCFNWATGGWEAENATVGAYPTNIWGAADGTLYDPAGVQFWVVAGVQGGGISDAAWFWTEGSGWQSAGNTGQPRYRLEGEFKHGDFFQLGGATGGFSYTPTTVRGRNIAGVWNWTQFADLLNARMDNVAGLTMIPEGMAPMEVTTPSVPPQPDVEPTADLKDAVHAVVPGTAQPGTVIENFPNTWGGSTIGLVYNPSTDFVRFAHESQPTPTIFDVLYPTPHPVVGVIPLSAVNPGWPVSLDNRDGVGYDFTLDTYFLPDFNGDVAIADDNIVEIDPGGVILNAWETDGVGNDSYDGSFIDTIIDIAVVPGSPTRYFVAAAYDGSLVYEIDLVKTGAWWTPATWGTLSTCTVPGLGDNVGIDYDAQNNVLYHSDWNSSNIVVTDLNCNVISAFTCPSPSGFNTGVTFIEGKSPPEIWVTDFGSNSTTRCEAVSIPVLETLWSLDGYGSSAPDYVDWMIQCPFCPLRGWLEGYVMDSETGDVDPTCTQAFVHIEPGNLDIPVDPVSGYYGPVELISGTYYLEAIADGFTVETAMVTIVDQMTTIQDFNLWRPVIAVNPTDFISVTGVVSYPVVYTLTIFNDGHVPLGFEITEVAPAMGLGVEQAALGSYRQPPAATGMDPAIFEQMAASGDGMADFYIAFSDTADLAPAYSMGWRERGRYVVDALQAAADAAQANVRAWLDEGGVEYTSYWINNTIFVHADEATLYAVAAFPEVSGFKATTTFEILPVEALSTVQYAPLAPSYPWNVQFPGADLVHTDFGILGQGIVIGGMDTGVEYDHIGLVSNYRGNLGGGSFDHTYSWYDPNNACAGTPCDTHGHGTATMGIMSGDDDPALPAGAWIGMAPDAQWIHCLGCPGGSCPDNVTAACAQWFLAPGGDPDLRPQVVNHSWGTWSPNDCNGNAFQAELMAYRAADILPAFAAGNVGDYVFPPHCWSSTSPANNTDPSGNPIAFASGAHGSDGLINYYSSGGPSACNNDNLFPDLVAPGSGSCTTGLGGTYNCSFGGTSSASPHTAGCVALVRAANPALTVPDVEQVLRDTANDVADGCGTPPETPDWNNIYGEGHLDCYEAVAAALGQEDVPWMWEDPISGTIPTEDSLDVEVTFHCEAPGDYTATLRILHNDPCAQPWVDVPVVIHCLPPADVGVTKSDDPDPVYAGEVLTYTLTATNYGPYDATGVTVVDWLPAGVTFVSASPGCVEAGGIVTCAVGNLPPGGYAVLTIEVTAPDNPGWITNNVEVSANEVDPVPGNNADSEDTEVLPAADLGVTKSDDPDPVYAGEALIYTLTATNYGPSAATGVTVIDWLPAGVTFVSASPGCAEAGGIVTCSVGGLVSGDFVVLTIEVIAPDNPGTITNDVEVSANQADLLPGNNTDSEDTQVLAAADLGVTKSDDPDPVYAGEALIYTLTATNYGPSDATGVTVIDTLPAGVTFVSASPGCVEAGGIVTCDVGDLVSGDFVELAIEVIAPDNPGTITNDVEVSGNEADLLPGNDTASEDTQVLAAADLGVTKSDDPDPVYAGETLTYTLTATNYGPSEATGVTVVDSLPAGVTFLSASPGCTEDNGVVTCSVGSLTSGDNLVLTIVVTAPGLPGTISNDVEVSAAETDPDDANNTATEDTTVTAVVDLGVTKSAGPDPVYAGETLTYTVTATNYGPSDATGVSVVDTLPAGVTFVSASPGCAEVGGIVTCTVGDLANGSSATVTIVVTAPDEPGTISNDVVVSANEADPDDSNNSASADTAVLPAGYNIYLPIIMRY